MNSEKGTLASSLFYIVSHRLYSETLTKIFFLKKIFLNFFGLVVVRVVFIWAFLCFGFLRQGLPCSQSWPRTCGFRRCKTSLQSWAVLSQPLELWDIGLSHYALIWLFWDLKKICVCVCVRCVLCVCHVSTESRRGHGFLELELEVVLRFLIWVLGTPLKNF